VASVRAIGFSVLANNAETAVIPFEERFDADWGMALSEGSRWLKDITDVVALIEELRLPSDFATQLNPYVRERFTELWTQIQLEGAPLDEESR
jgi:hypothetical protein